MIIRSVEYQEKGAIFGMGPSLNLNCDAYENGSRTSHSYS